MKHVYTLYVLNQDTRIGKLTFIGNGIRQTVASIMQHSDTPVSFQGNAWQTREGVSFLAYNPAYCDNTGTGFILELGPSIDCGNVQDGTYTTVVDFINKHLASMPIEQKTGMSDTSVVDGPKHKSVIKTTFEETKKMTVEKASV